MATEWRIRWFAGWFFLWCVATSARAECGGQTQCIGVGPTPAAAELAHHSPGSSTFTLAFGSQALKSSSAAKTVYVVAVTGPQGTQARIGAIRLSGTDASQFAIVRETCTTSGPVHKGAPCEIQVAFRPTTEGAKRATLHVPLNPPACNGCLTERSVTLTGTGALGLPTASNASLSVAANTPTTLDLAEYVGGNNLQGVRVTTPPAHGTVVLDGLVATYTPRDGYLGADAFSYQAYNAIGSSTPAEVRVDVLPRPSPAANRDVRAVLASQARTVHQFGATQMRSVQSRLDSLRRVVVPDPRLAPRVGAGMTAGPLGPSDSGPALQAAEMVIAAAALSGDGREPLLARAGWSEPAGAPTLGGNLSLSAGTAGGGGSGPGLWASTAVGYGRTGDTETRAASRFEQVQLSAGYDFRMSQDRVVGFSAGFARGGSQIGEIGEVPSRVAFDAASLSLYGSMRPHPDWVVDAQLGHARFDFDASRHAEATAMVPEAMARSQRDGRLWFGALAASYQMREGEFNFAPYGRLEFLAGQLAAARESGAGLNSLSYFEQSLRGARLAAGLRAEMVRELDHGVLIPGLRFELSRDLSRDGDARLAYADMESGPHYRIAPAGYGRSSTLLGLGAEYLGDRGLRFGADYQALRGSGNLGEQSLRLWLTAPTDGAVARSGLLAGVSALPLRAEAGYTLEDNLTRASKPTPGWHDQSHALTLGTWTQWPAGERSRVVARGGVTAEKFQHAEGLDRSSLELGAEWQYRGDSSFDAITYGLSFLAAWDAYRSGLRDGRRYALGINARMPLSDRVEVQAALVRNLRDAESALFDTRDLALRLAVEYALAGGDTAYAQAETRRGDIVASGKPMADSAAIARVLAEDDAFFRVGYLGYRFAADSLSLTLGYNLRLGGRDALDFSLRHTQAEPSVRPDYSKVVPYPGMGLPGEGGASRYRANQLGVAYLLNF